MGSGLELGDYLGTVTDPTLKILLYDSREQGGVDSQLPIEFQKDIVDVELVRTGAYIQHGHPNVIQ